MGKRQQRLAAYLREAGLTPILSASLAPPRLTWRSLELQPWDAASEEIYQALGGIKGAPRCRPGVWDMVFVGMVVELDEEQHFNRYRKRTLVSPVYDHIQARYFSFPRERYHAYCTAHEEECLTKSWNNRYWSGRKRDSLDLPSSEEGRFGLSSPRGDLDSGNGPARWKQRAFYDFLKDLTLLVTETPVARVAIWDCVAVDGQERRVDAVLDMEADIPGAGAALARLVRQRAAKEIT